MRSNATSAGRRGTVRLLLRPRARPGVRPLPPLVLQAGHVGEVGRRDRVDRPPEVDDGAIPFVVIVVADLARKPPGHDALSRSGEVEGVPWKCSGANRTGTKNGIG